MLESVRSEQKTSNIISSPVLSTAAQIASRSFARCSITINIIEAPLIKACRSIRDDFDETLIVQVCTPGLLIIYFDEMSENMREPWENPGTHHTETLAGFAPAEE